MLPQHWYLVLTRDSNKWWCKIHQSFDPKASICYRDRMIGQLSNSCGWSHNHVQCCLLGNAQDSWADLDRRQEHEGIQLTQGSINQYHVDPKDCKNAGTWDIRGDFDPREWSIHPPPTPFPHSSSSIYLQYLISVIECSLDPSRVTVTWQWNFKTRTSLCASY